MFYIQGWLFCLSLSEFASVIKAQVGSDSEIIHKDAGTNSMKKSTFVKQNYLSLANVFFRK